MGDFHATTIIAVKVDGRAAIAGDGQVTFGGNTIMKQTAKKLRRIYNDKVVAGFAGSVADAFTLFGKFEGRLQEFNGNLLRAAVETAKEWRMDRALRRLEALLIVTDGDKLLILSGSGEVIEPDDGIAAVGSGGSYALAAARALSKNTELSPAEIVREALDIASDICVFTNKNVSLEEIIYKKEEGK